MPTLDEIAKFINTVGMPTALVTAALFAVWYFARMLAKHGSFPAVLPKHPNGNSLIWQLPFFNNSVGFV